MLGKKKNIATKAKNMIYNFEISKFIKKFETKIEVT